MLNLTDSQKIQIALITETERRVKIMQAYAYGKQIGLRPITILPNGEIIKYQLGFIPIEGEPSWNWDRYDYVIV